MHQLSQHCKVDVATIETKNNGAPTLASCDCAGFNHATFLLAVGITDVAVDCQMLESDDDSTYVAIADSDITQIADTGDDRQVAIEIDLTAGVRKRYLRPSITCGNSTTGAALCGLFLLDRADDAPVAVADAGLAERVSV